MEARDAWATGTAWRATGKEGTRVRGRADVRGEGRAQGGTEEREREKGGGSVANAERREEKRREEKRNE